MRAKFLVGVLLVVAMLCGCRRDDAQTLTRVDSVKPDPFSERRDVGLLPGMPLGDGLTIAPPNVIGNLSVFPVYGARYEEVVHVVALSDAIRRGRVTIKELGHVRELSFDNSGDAPVLGLGGSVLEGGRQDRMIVQDVVLEPQRKLKLAVFCTERDRWTPIRNGEHTRGIFDVMDTFAGSDLRSTGEIIKNQGLIWSRVGQINRAHCAASATNALAGTLQNPALSKRRNKLAKRVLRYLDELPMREHLVGMGTMVNGVVRDVRLFANHQLFDDFRKTLARTAAFEAIARPAKLVTPAESKKLKKGETTAQDRVVSFVRSIREHPHTIEEKPMGDITTTRYHIHKDGYASIAVWRQGDRSVPITASFIAKPRPKDSPMLAECVVN
jgi:hypothetical protein